MRRDPALSARDVDVLHSIVKTYIETGEPVASRIISRRRGESLSAASIRNIMADLCDEGFLSQPHTSAGRVPTQKAFESYVRSLDPGRILAAELSRIRDELRHADTVEGRIERSSHLLTEMTRSVGIAAAIPTSSQTLDHIELIGLAEQRVLMIVVTRDRIVRNRVVTLDQTLGQEELLSIRNYLNAHFSGWVLSNVHRELRRILAEESAACDAILKRLVILYEKGLLDVDFTPEVHMEGASNLIAIDLRLTRERLKELFQALEEKQRVLDLLDRFLEAPVGEVAVHIGLEDAHPSMRPLSLIGVSVALPSGLAAKIAVLGPMRMNYERVISTVLHMGRAFTSLD